MPLTGTKIVEKYITDLQVGDHLTNRGDIVRIEGNGVFRTIWYVEMSWNLQNGQGATVTTPLTVHSAGLAAVSV